MSDGIEMNGKSKGQHLRCPLGECGSECERLQTFASGSTLFNEGEPGDYIYYIAIGRIAVSRKDSSGISRVASVADKGELVGIDALGQASQYKSTAVTLQPCLLCVIPRSKMGTDPGLTSRVLEEMCRRLNRAESHL